MVTLPLGIAGISGETADFKQREKKIQKALAISGIAPTMRAPRPWPAGFSPRGATPASLDGETRAHHTYRVAAPDKKRI